MPTKQYSFERHDTYQNQPGNLFGTRMTANFAAVEATNGTATTTMMTTTTTTVETYASLRIERTTTNSTIGPATQKQRGIVSFGIAPNRQNPFAGAGHDAIFNTWRRFSRQVLYWAPPFIAGYYIVQWATERYVERCSESCLRSLSGVGERRSLYDVQSANFALGTTS